MRLTKQATERIASATVNAVKNRPAGVNELQAVIAAAVGAATREVLAAVESELKTRRFMSFRGPHDPAEFYRSGDCVQKAGALWVCMADTGTPPASSPNWRRIATAKE